MMCCPMSTRSPTLPPAPPRPPPKPAQSSAPQAQAFRVLRHCTRNSVLVLTSVLVPTSEIQSIRRCKPAHGLLQSPSMLLEVTMHFAARVWRRCTLTRYRTAAMTGGCRHSRVPISSRCQEDVGIVAGCQHGCMGHVLPQLQPLQAAFLISPPRHVEAVEKLPKVKWHCRPQREELKARQLFGLDRNERLAR